MVRSLTSNVDPQTSKFREVSGLLLVNKPEGIPTHSPGDGKEGFVEKLTKELQIPLKVCHRLDADTSGAIIFGITGDATKKICALFETHQMVKRYLIVTDRPKPSEGEMTHRSFIKKYRGRHVSWSKGHEPNSETMFRFLQASGRFSLWEASPRTGKPHQIRLHGKDLGIPVLGDKMHGGSRFPRLMLHAESIKFTWEGVEVIHRVEPPTLFTSELSSCEAIMLNNGLY